ISLRLGIISESFNGNTTPRRMLHYIQASKFKDTSTNPKSTRINLINLGGFQHPELSHLAVLAYFDPRLFCRIKKLIGIPKRKSPFAPGRHATPHAIAERMDSVIVHTPFYF